MSGGRSRQLPLTLPHQPGLSAGDFLVGEGNRAAFQAIGRWPDWPAPVLWLWGPAGSGKSHLVEIWRARSGASAIRASDLDDDGLEPLLVSGAAAVEAVDQAADERALFHLINFARQRGADLLLTSRLGPGAFAPALPDLASRLRAAHLLELGAPGDDLLRRLLVKLFADRQLSVEPSLVDFILNRMERSFEAASSLVARLDEAALAEGRAVTRPLAAAVLSQPTLD